MHPLTPLHWVTVYMQLMGCSESDSGEFARNINRTGRHDGQDSVLSTANFPRLEFLHLARVGYGCNRSLYENLAEVKFVYEFIDEFILLLLVPS